MSKRLKQLLSFALVLCMAFTMLPMGAFAAEDAEPGLDPDTPTIDGVTPIDVNAYEYIFPLHPLGEYAAIYPAFGEYKWRIPMYTAAQPEMPEEFYAMLEDPESYGIDAIAAMIENHSMGFINTLEDSLKRAGISVDQAAQGTWTSENDVLTIADGWLTANKMGMAKVKLTYMAEEAIAPPQQQETPAEPALKPPVTKPKQAAEPAPEPEPEVTPEPEPESAPEPTPEAEAVIEPEATPEVEPALEAAPDPAPEPAPEPEPEPTPEPEPEVTPEPEPTPAQEPAPEAEVIPESAPADTTATANQEVQTQMVEKTLTWDIPIYDFDTSLLDLGPNDVALIGYPRANWPNEYKGGTWNHGALTFKNGWYTSANSNNQTHIRAIGSYSGQICYCIEPGIAQDGGDTLGSKNENFLNNLNIRINQTITNQEVTTFIGRILEYGYQGKVSTAWQFDNNAEMGYLSKAIATQLLIWETVVGERDKDFNHIGGGTNNITEQISSAHPLKSRIDSYYSNIEGSVKRHPKLPSFCDNATPIELVWNGTAYTTTVTDTNGVLENYQVSSTNRDVILQKNGNNLTITSPNAISELVISVSKTQHAQRQTLVVWSDGNYQPGHASNKQDIVTYSANPTSEPISGSFKIKTGEISISTKVIKTAEVNGVPIDIPVKGAVFGVYDGDTEKCRGTTGEDGQVILEFQGDATKQYTLKEISAPEGYFNEETTHTFSYNGQQQTITIKNKGDLSVTIEKTRNVSFENETTPPSLAGAEFELRYSGKGDVLSKHTTDANGLITISGLIPGTYTLTETKAPTGFGLPASPNDVTTFTIGAGNVVTNISGGEMNDGHLKITNIRETVDIPVSKEWLKNDKTNIVDEILGLQIKVELWRQAGDIHEKAAETVLNGNSETKWADIFKDQPKVAANGQDYIYTVKEVVITTEPDKDFTTLTNFINKEAGTTDKVVTKIERVGETNVFKVFGDKTNANDEREILGIFIAEDKDDGTGKRITNTWYPADNLENFQFSIYKKDAEKDSEGNDILLQGAEFTLTDQDNREWKAKTDENGVAVFEFLSEGVYTLKESIPPVGYVRNDATWTVTITKNLSSVTANEDNPNWTNTWDWSASHEETEPNQNNPDAGIMLISGEEEPLAPNHVGDMTIFNHRIKGRISIAKLLELDGSLNHTLDISTIDKPYTFKIYRLADMMPAPVPTLPGGTDVDNPEDESDSESAPAAQFNLIMPARMATQVTVPNANQQPPASTGAGQITISHVANLVPKEDAEPVDTVEVIPYSEPTVSEPLDFGMYVVVEDTPESVTVPSYTWQSASFTPGENSNAVASQDGKCILVNVREQDQTLAVAATNAYTRKEGTLSLRKVIENYAGDRDRDWTFDITLTSPQPYVKLASSYPYTVGEESYTLDLQPIDSVEENPSDTPAEAEPTPEPSAEGEEGSEDEPSVDIGEPPIDDSMVSSVMKGQIKLKHGEEAVIFGLPEGTTFQITELEANTDSYITTGTVTVSDLPEDAGIAPLADMADTVGGGAYPIDSTKDTLVTFTNSKRLGNLVITKTVERRDGTAPDAEETFGFIVNLYTDSSKQTPLEGTYQYTYTNGAGEAGAVSHGGTVTLRHGQSLTIQNLPASAHYEVEEQIPDGYTVTTTGNIGDIPVNGGTHTAAFVNRTGGNTDNGSGSLAIRKNVSGLGGELDREFTFTVALSAPGTYHYTGSRTGEIANGGTITLRHGEAITISGLPAGTTYTVTETEIEGYDVLASGDTGTILNNTVAEAVFDNANDEIPEGALTALTLSKVVTGNAGNKNQDFHFIIVLLDEKGMPLTEEYRYVGTGSADAEKVKTGSIITLKDGQTLTILDLPIGTKYSITEREAGQNGYITSCIGAEQGIISATPSRVTFVNQKGQGAGHLSIHKTVTGGNADQNQDWDFVITLANADLPLESSYTYSGSSDSTDIPAPANGILYFTDGVGTIRLRHGQSITIRDLPVGTTYTVTETQANADGYTTTANGANGTIADNATAAASFVNDRPSPGRPGGGGGGGRRPTPDTEINEPDTPRVYYPGETPNPNEPDSPNEILIMEDDVPQSYIKTWDPENEEYVYMPEEPIPLAPMDQTPIPLARLDSTPKTNDPTRPWFWLGLCIASILGIGLLKPRKKNDEE